MRPRGNRAGLTLVELLFTTLLFLVLFLMVWYFFRAGRLTVESNERKVDAIQRTHLRFEALRHDLECSRWAWAQPAPEHAAGAALGGHLLLAERKELLFVPDQGRLYAGGHATPGIYRDVRFLGQDDFLIRFLLSCDRSTPANTGKPGFRERSTLVSKVFVEPQAEEARERHHVWEDSHRWCVLGSSIHYPFTD